MKSLPKQPHPFEKNALKGCFIAGGAILSAAMKSKVVDYDIYPKNFESAVDFIHYLFDEESSFVINVSNRSITFKSNNIVNDDETRAIIQVMIFDEFDSPDKIFQNFDFTVCMGAFDGDSHEYHFHGDFFPDVASRTLRYNPNTKFPFNSMLRIGKYLAKGFHLPKSEMIRMCLNLQKMPSSWEELENAIGGSYGKQVMIHKKDEMEFSIENAMKLFEESEIEIFSVDDDEEENLKNITAISIERFFNRNELRCHEMNSSSKNEMNSYSKNKHKFYFLDNENKIFKDVGLEHLLELLDVSIEKIDPETKLCGYKTLVEGVHEDGSLSNTIYSSKRLRYSLGEETEENVNPYIFVAIEPKHTTFNKKNSLYKVEFSLKDLKKINENEINVSKIKVLEKVKEN